MALNVNCSFVLFQSVRRMSAAMPDLNTRESFSPGPSRVKWNDKWFDFLFPLMLASCGHGEFESCNKE